VFLIEIKGKLKRIVVSTCPNKEELKDKLNFQACLCSFPTIQTNTELFRI